MSTPIRVTVRGRGRAAMTTPTLHLLCGTLQPFLTHVRHVPNLTHMQLESAGVNKYIVALLCPSCSKAPLPLAHAQTITLCWSSGTNAQSHQNRLGLEPWGEVQMPNPIPNPRSILASSRAKPTEWRYPMRIFPNHYGKNQRKTGLWKARWRISVQGLGLWKRPWLRWHQCCRTRAAP